MRSTLSAIRDRLDHAGVLISGLCVIHCLAGLVLVALLGIGGSVLLAPEIHRIGLGVAVAVGAVALGLGVLRHGSVGPLIAGGFGLALMAAGLIVSHGVQEAALTIAGVCILAAAHIRNLRQAC